MARLYQEDFRREPDLWERAAWATAEPANQETYMLTIYTTRESLEGVDLHRAFEGRGMSIDPVASGSEDGTYFIFANVVPGRLDEVLTELRREVMVTKVDRQNSTEFLH